MKPSVGRIVQYWVEGWDDDELRFVITPHAAIVIAVHDDTTVDLQVFWQDAEISPEQGVKFAPFFPQDDRWTWPTREE